MLHILYIIQLLCTVKKYIKYHIFTKILLTYLYELSQFEIKLNYFVYILF